MTLENLSPFLYSCHHPSFQSVPPIAIYSVISCLLYEIILVLHLTFIGITDKSMTTCQAPHMYYVMQDTGSKSHTLSLI